MDANLVFTQVTAGAACAYVLRLLQQWKALPWVTSHTTGINTAIRLILSGAATLGISWQWAAADTGGHTLTIAIPSAMVVLHGAWQWFGQYALQHGWGQLFQLNGGQQAQAPAPAPPPQ